MRLQAYLDDFSWSQRKFAKVIGVDHSTISLILDYKLWPSRWVWQRIHEVTSGKVTPNDMLWAPDT